MPAICLALLLKTENMREEKLCPFKVFLINCLKKSLKKLPECEVICMSNFVFMLHLFLSVIYQGLTLGFFLGHYKEHCAFITAL